MIMNDKKRIATIISSKLMPNGTTEDSEKPKNENGDDMEADLGLKSAAEEMISAVERKDASSMMNALKSFISMIEDMEDSQEQE